MAPPPAFQSFKVHRREPELITPCEPTPHEFKPLSDIDDQQGLRFYIPGLSFYPYNRSMHGKDPVKMIREAIAKALVFYYPLAGRLREGPDRKLVVECTGEGILFAEADADVTLEQLGDPLVPPFPFADDLIFDFPAPNGILNCPLWLIQVTRLRCGGFTFGLRMNHPTCDAFGMVRFLSAIADIVKGADAPSVLPVWERHVLRARNPPQVTYQHCEYDEEQIKTNTPTNMRHQTFFFGPKEMSTLRRLIPPHLRHCTTSEILTACIWKCRTIAFQPNPTQQMHLISVVNLRNKLKHLVPAGYYGNAFILPGVVTSAKELSQNPISFALELVRKVKDNNVTEEYVRSAADLMIVKDRPRFISGVNCLLISDVRRVGFKEVDFGWGKAVYGGPARVLAVERCYFIAGKGKNGEDGIVLPVCLPAKVMERFVKELNNTLGGQPVGGEDSVKSNFLVSAL